MSNNEINRKFGEVAADEGIITHETLEKCISRHREIVRNQDPYPTFKSFLIRNQDLTEEEVRRIEQKMRQDPDHLDLPGYDIERKLGSGTSGTVYKATQLKLDRPVAIKLLHPSLSDDESFVDRFYQEIRTVGNLKHTGIVQGIDVGEDKGLIYFIMEYVEGSSLAEVIQEEGPISEERAIEVGHQMTSALAHAAENDLIHRDVKPDNIMFDDSGRAKLCDLGLAREVDGKNQTSDDEHDVVGTPNYMSPEQASGKELDIRSDLYSLGATLYHAVTGSTPFYGDDIKTIMRNHVSEELVPPKQRNNQLSPQFNAVIEKLMAKDPDERYDSPEQASEDFERLRNKQNPLHATFQTNNNQKRTRMRRHLNKSWLSLKSATALIVLFIIAGITLFTYNAPDSSGLNDGGSIAEKDQKDPAKTQQKNDSNTTDDTQKENLQPEKNNRDDDGEPQPDHSSGQPSNKTDDAALSFTRIKQSAEGIDGSVPRVKQIVSRLDQLSSRTGDTDVKRKISQFRGRFLKRQANLYLRRKTGLEPGQKREDASIETLLRLHRVLQTPPSIFEQVSFFNDTQDPLQTVQDLIKQQTREKNRRLVSRLQHNLPEHLARILNKYKFKHVQKDTDETEGEQLASGENTKSGSDEADNETTNSTSAGLTVDELPVEKQAEHAQLAGPSVQSDVSGYHGEGYVVFDQTNSSGDITWTAQLAPGSTSSPFRLQFRYAIDRDAPFPMILLVNGKEVSRGSINPTGAADNWQTFAVQTDLQQGKNTITLRAEQTNGPHVDALNIIPQAKMEKEAEQTVSGQKNRRTYEGPLEFTDVSVGKLAFAINFGGDAVNNGGIPFIADPFQSKGQGSKEHSSGDIAPEKFKALFRDQRVGENMSFIFPLANGTYDVRLYFIETWYEQVDGRVFHVYLQDNPVLRNFDIYKTINEKNQGMTKTFQDVPVTDKRLRIQLKGRVKAGISDDAIIAGIAIMRTGKP